MDKPLNKFGRVIVPEKPKKRKKTKNIRPLTEKTKTIKTIKNTYLLDGIFGFLCGGISLFGGINPIGISCIGAYYKKGLSFYVVCLGVFMGYILNIKDFVLPMYILAICFALVLDFFENYTKIIKFKNNGCIKMSICLFVAGCIFSFKNGFSIFILSRTIVESITVYSMGMVLNSGILILKSDFRRHIFDGNKAVAVAMIFIIAVSSLLNMGEIGKSLAMFGFALITVSMGFLCGASVSAAIGASCGILCLFTGAGSSELFLMLTVGGLFAGAVNENRIFSSIGLWCGFIIPAFYLSVSTSRNIIFSMAFATAIFCILPQSLFNEINCFSSHKAEFDHKDYFIRLKIKLENQLKMFATTFGALAEIFTTAEAPVDITPKSASYIIDVVTQSVCEDCSLSLYCWKNKQFEAYEGIHRLVGAAERNGDISEEETTIWFKDSCVRLKRIMEETKVRTREFKTNLVWQHRLFQNRSILKEQLICAENIISSLGTTVLAEPIFYESLEKEIRERLKKLGVDISKIYVANDGLFEISITKPQCFQNNQCLKTLLPIINATTGCRFVISSKCKVDRHGNCIVVFNETKGFRVKTGFASSTKFGSNVSGDTYILDTICNKGILALCDGMGSGKAAAQESQRVSQLIKKFLYAGLDLTLAVKVLNSALAVSSENDMYTTLDICSIDLITGETEIIKNGGATVFVYDGEKVNTIRSQSLPVGVIDHWTGEKTDLQLLSDYMLIMVTDGITEALGVDYEGIFVEELIFTYGTNPEKIAQKILEGAKAKQTKENSDDMTVLTIKLYT